MNLYLAESGGCWGAYFKGGIDSDEDILCQANFHIKKNGSPKGYFEGANILQSFFYCNELTENTILLQCKNFLLDSGAFTFMTSAKGKAIDWNEYIARYVDFIKRNNVQRYFELDIDSVVGYEKVKQIRRTLEKETGRACIPVWHKSRGYDDFLRMCDEYDYVSVGGIVSGEIKPKQYPIFTKLIDEAHKRGAKIHGLGFTNLQGLKKYHFDSVDSTAWVSGNRFGSIYIFDGKTMIKHDKKQGQRLASARDVALHNFNEWKKFAAYAETHL